MITLNRKTPKEKYNLDLNIRYVKLCITVDI